MDIGPIDGISVIIQTAVREGPQRLGLLLEFLLDPLPFAVAQKRAETARIQVIQDGYQETIVELERVRKLLSDLPDAIDELQENWRTIGIGMVIITVSNSLINKF